MHAYVCVCVCMHTCEEHKPFHMHVKFIKVDDLFPSNVSQQPAEHRPIILIHIFLSISQQAGEHRPTILIPIFFIDLADVGYAQGMNDILSRFLVVLDCEADAYWCFAKHLERIQMDFVEEGMVDKLGT